MNNVVDLFQSKKIKEPARTVFTDVTDIVNAIVDWADANGIDVISDVGFQIRCTDFMSRLQMSAKDANEERKTA